MDKGTEEKKLTEGQAVSSDIARRRAQAEAGERSTDFFTQMMDKHDERLEEGAAKVEAGVRGGEVVTQERMRVARVNLLRKNNPPKRKP